MLQKKPYAAEVLLNMYWHCQIDIYCFILDTHNVQVLWDFNIQMVIMNQILGGMTLCQMR